MFTLTEMYINLEVETNVNCSLVHKESPMKEQTNVYVQIYINYLQGLCFLRLEVSYKIHTSAQK